MCGVDLSWVDNGGLIVLKIPLRRLSVLDMDDLRLASGKAGVMCDTRKGAVGRVQGAICALHRGICRRAQNSTFHRIRTADRSHKVWVPFVDLDRVNQLEPKTIAASPPTNSCYTKTRSSWPDQWDECLIYDGMPAGNVVDRTETCELLVNLLM